MATVRLYMRDAAWYRNPSTDGRVVYPVDRGDGQSACSGVPLSRYTSSSVEMVHPGQLCRRAACRNRMQKGSDE